MAIFVPLYLAVAYLTNKKIDGKDFFARFAVINTPLIIDTLIFLLGVSFLLSLILPVFGVDPLTVDIDFFSRVIADPIASVAVLVFSILAFKKFK